MKYRYRLGEMVEKAPGLIGTGALIALVVMLSPLLVVVVPFVVVFWVIGAAYEWCLDFLSGS